MLYKSKNLSLLSLASLAFVFIFLAFLWPAGTSSGAESAASRLRGRILLAVQSRGEAWYVSPVDLKRYYLGRPADAFEVMKRLSLGVSNRTFDGFGGLAPKALAGRILLKVEDGGRAYYADPAGRKLYFLGRPADAFSLMRRLGLGISDQDLALIPRYVDPHPFVLDLMEKNIFGLVNAERVKAGLNAVAWNDDLANVAREHSNNLARDNRSLIDNAKLCSYPLIRHEGVDFGLYHNDRLNSRGIYYFGSSAENIALIPAIRQTEYSDSFRSTIDCKKELDNLNQEYEEAVEALPDDQAKFGLVAAEMKKRQELLARTQKITIVGTTWNSQTQTEEKTTAGWMASPGHRENILTAAYDQSGIGIARVNDYFIITQLFIKRAACGYRGGPCCEQAGYYPYCYQPLDCQQDQVCR